jgi:acetyltransferase-like isoleucine patch superfamily enzyme
VVLAAGSDDYIRGVATPLVQLEYKGAVDVGSIQLGRHCIVGAGSVVLPNVTLQDGAAVGALSLVKRSLEAWSLYAGIPARKIAARDRDAILSLEAKWRAAPHPSG